MKKELFSLWAAALLSRVAVHSITKSEQKEGLLTVYYNEHIHSPLRGILFKKPVPICSKGNWHTSSVYYGNSSGLLVRYPNIKSKPVLVKLRAVLTVKAGRIPSLSLVEQV